MKRIRFAALYLLIASTLPMAVMAQDAIEWESLSATEQKVLKPFR